MKLKSIPLLLLLPALMLLVACGGGSQSADTPTPIATQVPSMATPTPVAKAVATPTPSPTATFTPVPPVFNTPVPDAAAVPTYTPTQPPTPTPVPTLIPTHTPTTTVLPPRRQLEWPIDVGTSHFGALGNTLEEFPGAWIRPLPGRFIWGLMEPSKGEYLWEASDRWVRKWQEDRLGVLVMIWPFAQWDQDICHAEDPPVENPTVFSQYDPDLFLRMYPPCEPQSYASWLNMAVERYDGDGLDDMPGLKYPIRHWEIGNEPDMQSPSHTFFQGDSEAYLNLLKLSYVTVKTADPSAVVLIAAPSKWKPEVIEYWEPILGGGSDFFDVGNVHSLQGSDDFHASEYRRHLDDFGSSSKPFWITEAGVQRLEEEELAKITIPNYASAFAAGAHVVFRLARGHNTGQVLETYLLAAGTFGDFNVATGITENVVQFNMPDGRIVFALWEDGTLPAEVTGKVRVITYNGEESSQDASTVVAQVPTLVIIEPRGDS